MFFKSKIIQYMNNGCLFNNLDINNVPKVRGIYLIKLVKKFKDITILDNTTAIKIHNGQDMIYHNTDELYDKWLQGNREILAIGETDNLHKRINNLAKYSLGEDVPHRGERVLWQIEHWQNNMFEIYWMPTMEENLKFNLNIIHREEYGCLPLANMRP
jgi:hypothetical protein